MDFRFDFMTPDVWDGLVLGVVLIGLSLAALRLMSDWSLYRQQQARMNHTQNHQIENDTDHPQSTKGD